MKTITIELSDEVVPRVEPKSREDLEMLLLEGLDSRIDDFTDADWDFIDREVERTVAGSVDSRP